jgi:hypothetical protein
MTIENKNRPLTTNEQLGVQQELFDFVHRVESQYGLKGVMLVKSWCREKLPYGAFPQGYFDKQSAAGTVSRSSTKRFNGFRFARVSGGRGSFVRRADGAASLRDDQPMLMKPSACERH